MAFPILSRPVMKINRTRWRLWQIDSGQGIVKFVQHRYAWHADERQEALLQHDIALRIDTFHTA